MKVIGKLAIAIAVVSTITLFGIQAMAACFQNCNGEGGSGACPTGCAFLDPCSRTEFSYGAYTGSCAGGGGSEDWCFVGPGNHTVTTYTGTCNGTCGCDPLISLGGSTWSMYREDWCNETIHCG